MKTFNYNGFLLLVTLLLNTSVSAQNQVQRFFYELSYQPKNTSTYQKTTIMALDVNRNESVFKDYHFIISDSISYVKLLENQKAGIYEESDSHLRADFTFTINKNLQTLSLLYTDVIMNGLEPLQLGYEEAIFFDWKVLPETLTINSYHCQKATAHYGGRIWIAWFSKDIAINDGPYKFSGLPGLIIQVEDTSGHYKWQLVGNKVIKEQAEKVSLLKDVKSRITTKENFLLTYNTYKENPLQSLQNGLSREALDISIPGINMKLGAYIKQEESKIREYFKKNTNPIEVYP